MIEQPIDDLFGTTVIGASMGQAAHAAFPDRILDFGVGNYTVQGPIQTFHWEGVAWTSDVILGRLLWVGVALGITLLAALFIPTLALTLGIWSGSRKFFEVLYVVWWYIGPVSGLAALDFMGLSSEAMARGLPLVYLGGTVLLLGLAAVGRVRQIRR
ncbi:MAG: hypothetical protein U9R05_09155 [Chloroflexota bacterium]|nr:hypothetical protein [Chloroflexota bacterium]